MQTTTINLKKLYEEDYLLWIAETVKQLKFRQLNELDYDNLIEELETLGRSEKRAVDSLLKQLLIHLLLYQYWTVEQERNSNHWKAEIVNFRDQLIDEIQAKTIDNYARANLDNIYQKSLRFATVKSGLKLPSQCPYTFEQIIDQNWLPQT